MINDIHGVIDCKETDAEDTDEDGKNDIEDNCPDDPEKTEPGTCGCGVQDMDADENGVIDCKETDIKDTDQDGINDNEDNCPEDPDKTEPGTCGCGTPDKDTDKDGIPDCEDNNAAPKIPSPDFPQNSEENVSLLPVLQAGAFSDADAGDTHTMSQWQISTEPDFSFLNLDIETRTHLTTLPLPELILDENTHYYWRIRYADNAEDFSHWSDTAEFITALSGETPEIAPDISVTPGKNIFAVLSVKSVDPKNVIETGVDSLNRPEDLPLGLIAFKVKTETPGMTGEVIVEFSKYLSRSTGYYIFDPINGWKDFSAFTQFSQNRKSAVLTVKDGGFGDADGTENSIIVMLSGPGFRPATLPSIPAGDSSDDADNMGCFINTAKCSY